jgi:hypothetical protein
MIIASRFNGPPGSANGGYACGLFSEALGGGFEVTLLVPPPLDTQLDIVGDELRHGDVVVARARRAAHSDAEVQEPVSLAEAEAASKRYAGFEHHAYPTCFTCGPARDDGLGIFAGPVEGRDGLVAAPWTPEPGVRPEIVWAALDCPSGFACIPLGSRTLLATMAATIDAPVHPGKSYVVTGWPIASEGRKHRAGSAIHDSDGRRVAVAESLWITLRN